MTASLSRNGIIARSGATAKHNAGRRMGLDSLFFNGDGSRLLAAGNAGDVFLFDRASGKLLARLETGADMITSAAFSPDGGMIAALDNQQQLHLWRAAGTFELLATVLLRSRPGYLSTDQDFPLGELRRLAWLPDRRVAIATQSGLAVIVSVSEDDWLKRADDLGDDVLPPNTSKSQVSRRFSIAASNLREETLAPSRHRARNSGTGSTSAE